LRSRRLSSVYSVAPARYRTPFSHINSACLPARWRSRNDAGGEAPVLFAEEGYCRSFSLSERLPTNHLLAYRHITFGPCYTPARYCWYVALLSYISPATSLQEQNHTATKINSRLSILNSVVAVNKRRGTVVLACVTLEDGEDDLAAHTGCLAQQGTISWAEGVEP